MSREPFLLAALFACASTAVAQVPYCKDIGGNKTYCTGGTVIHHQGRTAIVPNALPAPPTAAPPNPFLWQNALPTLDGPHARTEIQGPHPAVPATVTWPARPDAPGVPVIVVPPAGSRICHQFGTAFVCK